MTYRVRYMAFSYVVKSILLNIPMWEKHNINGEDATNVL